jgi:undecaprenyl-diphosphatase
MLNPFDQAVVGFLNQFAHRSRVFDSLVVLVSGNSLLKGGFVMALYWWAWFRVEEREERREYLLFAMIAAAFAALAARGLAAGLPFRQRPAFDTSLHFQIPYNFDPLWLTNWSSFPSDHATLFFCLAAGLWFVSKPIGAVAMVHTLLIITFPRVYLGLHFPTDIIAGGLLGTAIASTAQISWLRQSATRYPKAWPEKYPAWFYSVMFVCSFETAGLYDGVRKIGLAMVAAIHHFLGS